MKLRLSVPKCSALAAWECPISQAVSHHLQKRIRKGTFFWGHPVSPARRTVTPRVTLVETYLIYQQDDIRLDRYVYLVWSINFPPFKGK